MKPSYVSCPATMCAASCCPMPGLRPASPRSLARGSRAMEQRLTEAVFKTVPQRVAATLLTPSAQPPKRPGLLLGAKPISITHEQLAALVGTSRETATKALDELADRGVIRLGRGRITVLDSARLADDSAIS
jgi:CRP/FNR family cyclic AMP-dependent transcriptional regulator